MTRRESLGRTGDTFCRPTKSAPRGSTAREHGRDARVNDDGDDVDDERDARACAGADARAMLARMRGDDASVVATR